MSVPDKHECDGFIHFPNNSKRPTKILRRANYPNYISDILRLRMLDKLKVCFAGLGNEELLKLVRFAIANNMSYLSVVDEIECPIVTPYKLDEIEKLSYGVRICNLRRCNRLSQAMVLLRTKHLRRMSTVFTEELLETLD